MCFLFGNKQRGNKYGTHSLRVGLSADDDGFLN